MKMTRSSFTNILSLLKKPKFLIPLTVSLIVTLLVASNVVFSNHYLNQILKVTETSEKIMISSNKNIPKFDSLAFSIVQLRNVSRQARVSLEVESYKLRQIKLFPFGNEFENAIDAYEAHINAWSDFYERLEACLDYNCYLREVNEPTEIGPTFKVAELAYLNAVPRLDLFNLENKISEIFAE